MPATAQQNVKQFPILHKKVTILNNLLLSEFLFGNENFGLNLNQSRPALYVFGFEIYLYALCIVTGMCLAILIGGLYFKKRGYDPYDVTIYALAVIPLGVLGARAYIYIFPWSDRAIPDWSTFFDFRSGGLGIYGGVIVGYLTAMVVAKIRKQDFRIIADCVIPGVFLAQSMGRWGNFFNQEAYGNLITHVYDELPHAASGLFAKFNGYAVWIDARGGWYQATFFYESVCTFLGFLVCVLILTRNKHYKLGWCTAFYGIFYGTARLIIEGMRSDSLYLYIGTQVTDIKISQLVSIFSILLGVWTLSKIYRKQLLTAYGKMFKSERDQIAKSRIVLAVISAICLALAIAMFALGGESKFIVGFVSAVVCIYTLIGVFAMNDRLKLYCKKCNKRKNITVWQSDYSASFTQTIIFGVAMGVLVIFGLFSLVKWGIVDGIPNGIVLAVVAIGVAIAMGVLAFAPACKKMLTSQKQVYQIQTTCACGETEVIELNSFLLFFYPPVKYLDYGVDHLVPWVDPEKTNKTAKAE